MRKSSTPPWQYSFSKATNRSWKRCCLQSSHKGVDHAHRHYGLHQALVCALRRHRQGSRRVHRGRVQGRGRKSRSGNGPAPGVSRSPSAADDHALRRRWGHRDARRRNRQGSEQLVGLLPRSHRTPEASTRRLMRSSYLQHPQPRVQPRQIRLPRLYCY